MTLLYQQRLREFRRNPKLKIEAVSSIESKTAAYKGEIGRVGVVTMGRARTKMLKNQCYDSTLCKP